MFGSTILEIAIGMILIYLVLSLIMTSVQEGIHSFGKARARNLQTALLELMQGDERAQDRFYHHPLISALHTGRRGQAMRTDDLPSYIPRETFSAAFLDVLERGEAIEAELPEELKSAVERLRTRVGGRAEALREEIERWYDAAMDRASGRFRRNAQRMLFRLSLGLALLLNVNSFTLAHYLAVSPQQRALVVELAERQWEQSRSADGETAAPPTRDELNALTGRLHEIGLPVGWKSESLRWIEGGFPNQRIDFDGPFSVQALFAWLLLLFGYLMTAFAMALGAPFWFDLLNKFMVIRGTVKPREKSRDEASEDRQNRRTQGDGEER